MGHTNSQKNITTCGRRKLIAKTCIKCHQFKSADEFQKLGTGLYQSNCKACGYKLSKLITQRTNHESWDVADRAGQPWTEKEIKELEKMRAEGKSYRFIGSILGRSETSLAIAYRRYVTAPKENS